MRDRTIRISLVLGSLVAALVAKYVMVTNWPVDTPTTWAHIVAETFHVAAIAVCAIAVVGLLVPIQIADSRYWVSCLITTIVSAAVFLAYTVWAYARGSEVALQWWHYVIEGVATLALWVAGVSLAAGLVGLASRSRQNEQK